MRSSGNGDKCRCTENLLAIVRGEVPYDRIRGLAVSPIDGPSTESEDEIQQDALWMLNIYEPRVEVDSVNVTNADPASGGFSVTANIR